MQLPNRQNYHMESQIAAGEKRCSLWIPKRGQGTSESEERRLCTELCQTVFAAYDRNRHECN